MQVIVQCWSLVPFLKSVLVTCKAQCWSLGPWCWSLGSWPKKNRIHTHSDGRWNGSPVHIGMLSVHLYLHIIMEGGVNFTNLGMASTTEKEPCGQNRHPGREVITFSLIKIFFKAAYCAHRTDFNIFWMTDRRTERQTKPIA